MTLLFAACSREEQVAAVPVPSLSEQITQGADIYNQTCAVCHFDGAGNPVAADLKGSPMVANNPSGIISAIVHGQSGISVANGKKLNGHMPAMAYFSDEEVAAVTAYVRATFADKQEAVDPATVAAIRARK